MFREPQLPLGLEQSGASEQNFQSGMNQDLNASRISASGVHNDAQEDLTENSSIIQDLFQALSLDPEKKHGGQ